MSMYGHLYGLAESSELDSESDSDMIWLKLRVSDHRAAEYCAQALLDEQRGQLWGAYDARVVGAAQG